MKNSTFSREIILITIGIIIAICTLYYISKNNPNSVETNLKTVLNLPKKRVKIIVKRINKPSQPVSIYIEHIESELQQLIKELIAKKTTSPICRQRKQTTVWRYGKDNMRGATILERRESNDDSRGIGVVWCVVGLLIISVIASLFDILNARSKTPKLKKTSSTDIAGNPAAARRCSLSTSNAAKHAKRQIFGSRRSATIAEGLPTKNFYSGPPAGMPCLRAKFD